MKSAFRERNVFIFLKVIKKWEGAKYASGSFKQFGEGNFH